MTSPPIDYAACFKRFGTVEVAERCRLYANLALGIAEDRALLDLVAHTSPGQPAPNMLFGAVRYLLRGLPAHPLADAFRTGEPVDGVFRPFRDFCLVQAPAIRRILETRRTQTNEVARCAIWLPALAAVGRATPRALALVEIGASAGLNLLFDRYRYTYSPGARIGPPTSPVQLRCDVNGELPPDLSMPTVTQRFGIDINPIHPQSEEDRRWLLALVWPGHVDREARLAAALEIAAKSPPDVWQGDALARLPEIESRVDPDAAICVLHSFVLYQFSKSDRAALDACLIEMAQRRAVTRIGLETNLAGDADLKVHTYSGDSRQSTTLATADPHGRWLRWDG